MDNVWIDIKEQLKAALPDHAFNTWFEPISFIGHTDNELVLEVPNQFFYEWIESHYKNQINNTAQTITGNNINIKYTVAPEKQAPIETTDIVYSNKRSNSYKANLNKRYSFSNFIEGPNNQFARAAALAVASSPGQQTFNPLLILVELAGFALGTCTNPC